MRRARFTTNRKTVLIAMAAASAVIVLVYTVFNPSGELYVIDESQSLEVYTPYGTFSGVAVGPHLILTVAHGADLLGDMTVNHYKVSKVWSDEDTDLALLQTEETFYLYSPLSLDFPLVSVKGRELGPGDSGTALINKAGAVCFLLQGYDHTENRYVYKPVTNEAAEAVRMASG